MDISLTSLYIGIHHMAAKASHYTISPTTMLPPDRTPMRRGNSEKPQGRQGCGGARGNPRTPAILSKRLKRIPPTWMPLICLPACSTQSTTLELPFQSQNFVVADHRNANGHPALSSNEPQRFLSTAICGAGWSPAIGSPAHTARTMPESRIARILMCLLLIASPSIRRPLAPPFAGPCHEGLTTARWLTQAIHHLGDPLRVPFRMSVAHGIIRRRGAAAGMDMDVNRDLDLSSG
jgi:hypothetical protein